MTQKTINTFIIELYSRGPRRNYPINKTHVYHFDNIWSLDFLGLRKYGPDNNRNYRYILVVIDNFSKIGWTILLKNEIAQTVKDSFENIITSSKSKPNLIATDRAKEFYDKFFQNFLNKNNTKVCSRNASLGDVFAEIFNRSVRDLLIKLVFEREDGTWNDILPTLRKQDNNRVHSFKNLSPIQASLENNEVFVYHNLLDKRKKKNQSFK